MGDEMNRDAALDTARRRCGWHVSPPQVSTHSSREPGGFNYLILPTQKVVSIDSITENGQAVDPADTEQFSNEPAILYKNHGHWHGDVEVTFTHGYAEGECASWWAAVRALENGATLGEVKDTLWPYVLNPLSGT